MRTITAFLIGLTAGTTIACATPGERPDDSAERMTTNAQAETPDVDGDGGTVETEVRPPEPPQGPARVLQARTVAIPEVFEPLEPGVKSAKLAVVSKRKGDPVREVPDPAPREMLTRRDLMAFHREYESRVDASALMPSQADERWRQYLERAAPPHLTDLLVRWFSEPNVATLAGYEQTFGPMESIEAFRVSGRPVHLVTFHRERPAEEEVSIFSEKHDYTVVAFDASDSRFEPIWALDLSPLHPGVLEMDDVQIGADGMLFVNANYQSYAREVGGETAFLYGIAPDDAAVLWRTAPLVSRGDFQLVEGVVVSGYGFTAEKDALYAIDARSGARLHKLPTVSGHDRIRRVGDELHVRTYDHDYVVSLTVSR